MMVTMVGIVTAWNGKKIELHRQILEGFKLRGVVGWGGGVVGWLWTTMRITITSGRGIAG